VSSLVFVAGHNGLVGSAICRSLVRQGKYEVITQSRDELDLRDGEKTLAFLKRHRPDSIIVAAGVVGGIRANRTRPVEFLSDNTLIALNVINGAFKANVERLVYLSSNCVYPRELAPPHRVEMIGQAPMEPTNEWYGTAKFLGMKLCESYQRQYGASYFSVIPTNTFGPGDSLEESTGHVISDLLLKSLRLTRASNVSKVLKLWGTGNPIREFLFVDDLADAIVFLFANFKELGPINIGGGEVLTIRDLAMRIVSIIDPEIRIEFDSRQPDGAPARFLDNSVLESLGWSPTRGFGEKLEETVEWYRQEVNH